MLDLKQLISRGLTISVACLVLCACQTVGDTLDAARIGIGLNDSYEEFDGQFIDTAKQRRDERAKVSTLTQIGEDLGGRKAGANLSYGLAGERKLNALKMEGQAYGVSSIEKYMQRVLDKTLQHWPHERPNFRVVLVENSGYSAFLNPNGIIAVNTGLIVNCTSEDELAFILAHEASHGLLLHQELDRNVEARKEIETRIAGGILLVSSLRSDNDPQSGENALTTIVGYGLYEALQSNVMTNSWKREQEDEADLLAFDLVTKAGYNPSAGMTVMKRLQETHRKEETKIAAAEQDFAQQVEATMNSGRIGEGTAMMLNKMFSAPGVIFSKLFDAVTNDHTTPEAREQNLVGYFNREQDAFLEVSLQELKEKSYQRATTRGTGGKVIHKRRAAYTAEELLAQGKLEEAEKAALNGLSGASDRDTSLRFALYKIRKAQKQERKAYTNLNLAAKDRRPPPTVYMSLFDEAMARQDYKTAQWALKQNKRYNNIGNALLDREILVYARSGQFQKASQAYQSCIQTAEAEKNIYMKNRCNTARDNSFMPQRG